MSSKDQPVMRDDKVRYYAEELYRELSNMFVWEGLPKSIPLDYLERTLIRHGRVMYYLNDLYGEDILRCEVTGHNRHDQPTHAQSVINTTIANEAHSIRRNVKRVEDMEIEGFEFDEQNDCVLLYNMERGQSTRDIVEHYAERLAMAQQAFDTNLLYTNMPYIFVTDNDETQLSIKKMFSDIYNGKPLIITDKALFSDNTENAGVSTNIPFIVKDLLDVLNEIKMKFRQTIGFDTAGVDKAERVNTLEIQSNEQHTRTVLEIMLSERQKAAKAIQEFFGHDVQVSIIGQNTAEDTYSEEVEDYGTGDSGIETPDRTD